MMTYIMLDGKSESTSLGERATMRKTLLFVVAASAVGIAAPLSGQNGEDVERDSVIESLKESGDYETVGNVLMHVSVDPITDETRASVLVPSIDLSRTGGGILIYRCTDDDFEVYVNLREYLGSEDRKVYYRFDSREAEEDRWSNSTTGTAVFADDDEEFARKAARAKKLAFRAVDYRGTKHTRTFELDGLREALSKLPCLSLEED